MVMIASAASAPPSESSACDRSLGAREELVHGQLLADQAGGADQDVVRGNAEQVGNLLCGGVGVLETLRAGAGVGAAGVQEHGVGPAVGDRLA